MVMSTTAAAAVTFTHLSAFMVVMVLVMLVL